MGMDGKMGARWSEGLFLGFSRDSNEFVLWCQSAKTVVRARSVQRKTGSWTGARQPLRQPTIGAPGEEQFFGSRLGE